MLGVMYLVSLLQLVRLFLFVLSVLVFSACRLCVLMCAVCFIVLLSHMRTHNLQAEKARTDNANRNKRTNCNKATKHITPSILLFYCHTWEHIIYKQKMPEQTTPTETSVPTVTKRLNISHQAFTSIYYNVHYFPKTSIFTEHTTNVVIQ